MLTNIMADTNLSHRKTTDLVLVSILIIIGKKIFSVFPRIRIG
jgi:hypothetical protein